ncbi:MAG: glycosyltransferase [Gammaproteobacteria bacterium]|nr:glycosyltransferase [Gammaproteobacteria bacterium]
MRRNLMISQALADCNLPTNILIVAGACQANAAQMPPGVDCVTLPSLSKNSDGSYRSRSLGIPLKDIKKIRAQMICSSIEAFEPDIFIVDSVPRGALYELDEVLSNIRRRGHTYCVLGLRDVLDEPERVKVEWHKAENEKTIRDFYDKVWIYSDPHVYDAIREYKMPDDIVEKVSYTGYFDRRIHFDQHNKAVTKPSRTRLGLQEGRFVLCMVGGGQDGASLTEAFARAVLPADMFAVIVTGPFMPVEMKTELHRIATTRANLMVFEYVSEPTHLIQQADCIVAMGGYNVVSEVLSYEKRALIIPRVTPKKEQLVRAKRLQELGIIDVILPDQVTPEILTDWIKKASQNSDTPSVHDQLDFKGLSRLPHLIREICQLT